MRAKLLAQLTKLHADIKAAPNVVAELSTKRRLPVQQLADKVLGGQRSRDEIHKALQRCKPALTLSGDAIRGQKTFVEATCSTCHRLGDLGTEIGPDLTTLVDRSPQNLIVAVVDPNRAVVAKYLEHVALTSDGLTYRGMLLEETSNQVTLVDVAGKSQVLLRKDLEELVCTGRSHMPEKLEEKLDQQQLADLFAFIRTMKPTVRTIVAHRPEVVAPEADNSLRLLAHQAEIHGARISYDAKQGCLVWHAGAPNDYVAWSADVAKPGVYEVSLVTAQIPEYADNPFSIEAGASRVVGRLPSTGGWGRWLRNDFGQLVLAAGRQRIVLRPDGPIKGELSDIRELRLAPIVRQ